MDEHAYRAGADLGALARRLEGAHDAFLQTRLAPDGVRDVVVDSWMRSVRDGVDPETALPTLDLDDDQVHVQRSDHPLSRAMPVVRRLLVETAADAGLLVAVSDAAGRLLWVEGASSLRRRAEEMHFVEGANWSEHVVGTNAPGTALALGRPVQILGAEHLLRPVTSWSCSAAPVHDPVTGAVLGVIDLTGGPEVASPQSLALVRATASAVEAELRLADLGRDRLVVASSSAATPVRLSVLGERAGLLHGPSSASRLGLRRAELLVLLAERSDGMTTAELAVASSERDRAEVTIRAELSRLRAQVAPLRLLSRPYRLEGPFVVDAFEVRDALRRGELRRAVASYPGPVLPQSDAPGVVSLREALHHEIRTTLMASGDPDALLGFADTVHGRDDLELWWAVLRSLPVGSPRRPQVEAHVERLDAELA